MSAEMLVSVLGFDRRKNGAKKQIAKCRKNIAALKTVKDVNTVAMDAYFEGFPIELIRVEMESSLKEIALAILGRHPERAFIWLPNGKTCILVSGGVSYGDSPTELFNDMEKIQSVWPDTIWKK